MLISLLLTLNIFHTLSSNSIVKFIIIIITFILIQKIDFTESLSNWKIFTGPNSAKLPFLYFMTGTLETVNVDLERNM